MEEVLGDLGSGGRSARTHLPGPVVGHGGRNEVRAHEVVDREGREGPCARCAPARTPTSSRMMMGQGGHFVP